MGTRALVLTASAVCLAAGFALGFLVRAGTAGEPPAPALATGTAAASADAALIEQLGADSTLEVVAAKAALEGRGEAAIPALQAAAVGHASRAVRRLAAVLVENRLAPGPWPPDEPKAAREARTARWTAWLATLSDDQRRRIVEDELRAR